MYIYIYILYILLYFLDRRTKVAEKIKFKEHAFTHVDTCMCILYGAIFIISYAFSDSSFIIYNI